MCFWSMLGNLLHNKYYMNEILQVEMSVVFLKKLQKLMSYMYFFFHVKHRFYHKTIKSKKSNNYTAANQIHQYEWLGKKACVYTSHLVNLCIIQNPHFMSHNPLNIYIHFIFLPYFNNLFWDQAVSCVVMLASLERKLDYKPEVMGEKNRNAK